MENSLKSILSKYSVYILLGLGAFLIIIYRTIFSSPLEAYSNTEILMGSNVTVSVYAKNDARAQEISNEIFEDISGLENIISAKNENSQLYKLNKEKNITDFSDTLYSALSKSAELNKDTDNAFSPMLYEISKLWNIGTTAENIPDKEDIELKLKSANIKNLSLNDGEICIKGDASVDLGAVGKGMACDLAEDYMRENNLSGAVIVGGSVLVYGEQPSKKDYTVEVRNPFGDVSKTIGVISLKSGIISTSGEYEKYFEKNGKIYHHIFDPKTGYPAESNLKSVTVICNDGFLSDALSTAVFVMGKEKGFSIIKKYNAEAIIVDKDKKVYVTDGVNFELTDSAFEIINNEDFEKKN